ncbi:Failed axon connections-like protein [Trichoplax sp. H2]|nr:Failed axon connections-like protein [Trichoplax sp. H2]|eukprot:RDD41082.1 Failed axon connections-like protein [Trichoplax sp. H2]
MTSNIDHITDFLGKNPYPVIAITIIGIGSCYFYITGGRNSKSKSFPKSPLAKPGLVVLHGANPGSSIVNPSPYVLKLQTFLRMAKIEYVFDRNNPMGRKGKMPWIELDGDAYCDSTFIIEHLTKKFNVSIDRSLSEQQKAVARVIQKTIEENTIWATIIYNRLIEEADWFVNMMKFPWFVGVIFKLFFVPPVKKNLYGHGIGRHTPQEIRHIARGDLAALSALLKDKSFFLGDQPTTIDACVFSFTANIIYGLRPGSWPNEMIKSEFPNLVAFTNRMKENYWPDWDEIISKA